MAAKMGFVRNAWYMAGWAADLAALPLAAVMILGEPIVLYRQANGVWTALEDVCCHRLAPLSLGRREGDAVRCMYHGLKFGADGKCIEIPGHDRVSDKVRVKTYPVIERHGAVWVFMGAVALADARDIPVIPDPGATDMAVAHAFADVDAHAELIWDNLLDLSHVIYVHLASFMGNDETMAGVVLASETVDKAITRTGKGVRVRRWQFDKPDHPFFADRRTDDCVISDFNLPGTLLLQFISYAPGVTARYPGVEPEDIPAHEQLSLRRSCQVVTPIDAARSRIFFSSGVDPQYAAYLPKLFGTVQKALIEDKVIVDAQQRNMDRLGDRAIMNFAMDAPILHYRALMAAQLQAEVAGAN